MAITDGIVLKVINVLVFAFNLGELRLTSSSLLPPSSLLPSPISAFLLSMLTTHAFFSSYVSGSNVYSFTGTYGKVRALSDFHLLPPLAVESDPRLTIVSTFPLFPTFTRRPTSLQQATPSTFGL